jgi:hypothetical protein
MIKELIKIANELDERGLHEEADVIEGVITHVYGKGLISEDRGQHSVDWRDYIRQPDEERECLTPDSIFHIYIGGNKISVSVDLPMELPELSEDKLQEMEDAMHDAMEAILAQYFEEEKDDSTTD